MTPAVLQRGAGENPQQSEIPLIRGARDRQICAACSTATYPLLPPKSPVGKERVVSCEDRNILVVSLVQCRRG